MQLRPVIVLLAVALAGCGGGGKAAPAPSVDAAQQAAVELAKCMRANGSPGFPDPVRDESTNWVFPGVENIAAPPACAEQAARLRQRGEQHTISSADMGKRRQYTACMREHGFPAYPDPDADGNFPLTPELRQLEDTPQMRAAEQACVHILPPK